MTTAEEGQSWSSSSSSADNKLCCGDQKYNYFVCIYFCIIIPQTHTTRTTDAMLTMSRRALIVAAVLLVDLANHPAIAQLLPAQEGRECELSCWLVGRVGTFLVPREGFTCLYVFSRLCWFTFPKLLAFICTFAKFRCWILSIYSWTVGAVLIAKRIVLTWVSFWHLNRPVPKDTTRKNNKEEPLGIITINYLP